VSPPNRSNSDPYHPGETIPRPPRRTRLPPAQATAPQARRGTVGPRLTASRSTRTKRTRRTTTGLNVRQPDHRHLLQAGLRLRSTRPTCAAGCAGTGCIRSGGPASTAGRPPCLSPRRLDDRYFMLRVRIDGGQLSVAQLRAILRHLGQVRPRPPPTSPTGRTSSLHWIEIESVPAIWDTLEGRRPVHHRGLRRQRPGWSSAARWPGLDGDELIDANRRESTAVTERYVGDPGAVQPAAQVQVVYQRLLGPVQRTTRINDVAFAAVRQQGHRRDRLRPLGRRRPVDQPDDRQAAGRLSSGRGRFPRSGTRSPSSSATTATGGCGTGRGSSS